MAGGPRNEGHRMEPVMFIECEDDGTDQIVSFAIEDDELAVRSLILLRTPKFEPLLDEFERGVSVSMGSEYDEDDRNLLSVVRLGSDRVTVETQSAKYDLDVGRVDPAELSEMKALLKRMNFDHKFEIIGV
jgi:hypothetical protein